MFNRKELPKQAFSRKLKKGKKISYQWGHLLAFKWKDVCHVLSLTTAHEDVLVEAPSSRGAHCKIKPVAVLDYNKYQTGADRSDQMLFYNSFARKTIKWWKKLFFHLFNLVMGKAHILHNKSGKKSHWKFSTKNLPTDCLLVLVKKIKLKVRMAVLLADM
jgi:hypothetical protein